MPLTDTECRNAKCPPGRARTIRAIGDVRFMGRFSFDGRWPRSPATRCRLEVLRSLGPALIRVPTAARSAQRCCCAQLTFRPVSEVLNAEMIFVLAENRTHEHGLHECQMGLLADDCCAGFSQPLTVRSSVRNSLFAWSSARTQVWYQPPRCRCHASCQRTRESAQAPRHLETQARASPNASVATGPRRAELGL